MPSNHSSTTPIICNFIIIFPQQYNSIAVVTSFTEQHYQYQATTTITIIEQLTNNTSTKQHTVIKLKCKVNQASILSSKEEINLSIVGANNKQRCQVSTLNNIPNLATSNVKTMSIVITTIVGILIMLGSVAMISICSCKSKKHHSTLSHHSFLGRRKGKTRSMTTGTKSDCDNSNQQEDTISKSVEELSPPPANHHASIMQPKTTSISPQMQSETIRDTAGDPSGIPTKLNITPSKQYSEGCISAVPYTVEVSSSCEDDLSKLTGRSRAHTSKRAFQGFESERSEQQQLVDDINQHPKADAIEQFATHIMDLAKEKEEEQMKASEQKKCKGKEHTRKLSTPSSTIKLTSKRGSKSKKFRQRNRAKPDMCIAIQPPKGENKTAVIVCDNAKKRTITTDEQATRLISVNQLVKLKTRSSKSKATHLYPPYEKTEDTLESTAA